MLGMDDLRARAVRGTDDRTRKQADTSQPAGRTPPDRPQRAPDQPSGGLPLAGAKHAPRVLPLARGRGRVRPSAAVGSAGGACVHGLADWRDFLPPPHRTVDAVLPHGYKRLASNLWSALRLVELNTGVDVRDRLADMRARDSSAAASRTRGSRRTTARISQSRSRGAAGRASRSRPRSRAAGATADILAGWRSSLPRSGAIRLEPALPACPDRSVHSQSVAAGSCAHRATTWRRRCQR